MKNSSNLAPVLDDAQFDYRVSSAQSTLNQLSQELYVIRSDKTGIPTHGGAFDLTVCQRLARLSHSLSNSSLRLFIHLWDLQLRDLSQAMFLSTRDLAAHAGLDAKSVRAALDQLYSRRAIVLRWGDSARPNRIYVCLWEGDVLALGAGIFPPPKPRIKPDVGEFFPHLDPKKEDCLYTRAGTRLDSDSDSDSDSDYRSMQNVENFPEENRGKNPPAMEPGQHEKNEALVRAVLNAKPGEHHAQRMIEAARLLHEAMRRRGERQMQPPDDVVTAQFLACGEWQDLQRVVMRIIQTGTGRVRKYGYFVASALEALHGIKPGDLHEKRQALKPQLVRQVARAVPIPPPPPPPPPPTLEERARDWGVTVDQMRVYDKLAEANPPANGADVIRLMTEAEKQK